MSPEWDIKFPNVTVQALDRTRSDHTPLLLNGKVAASTGNHTLFKFEQGWLIRDDFHDMVSSIWDQQNKNDAPPWKNGRTKYGLYASTSEGG